MVCIEPEPEAVDAVDEQIFYIFVGIEESRPYRHGLKGWMCCDQIHQAPVVY